MKVRRMIGHKQLVMTIFNTITENKAEWVVDTGATKHFTKNDRKFLEGIFIF